MSGCSEDGVLAEHVVSLRDLPSSVSRADWVKSQRADSSPSALWDEAVPADKIRGVAHGYFVQGNLLVRKLVPVMATFLGK